ncbi:uncharacterized protein TNCV_2499451 [Trichonephila clavipes]|nr:uncharacterized protein TNCV_2499451 [Trichonephila clavipes]
MASAVLADPTRALQGTNWGSGPAMEVSENDVGSLEQLLYADEHYFAGKVPPGIPFRKGCLHIRTRLSSIPKTNRDSSLNTTFCQSVIFHIDLAWHHCRRSCRCSDVKGSARKGRLDLRFASARCLEIVCRTIATPTSARIIEQVTVGPQVLAALSFDPGRSRPGFPRVGTYRVHFFQQFLTAHSERSTWPATRLVGLRAVFIPMIRPLKLA